MAQNKYANLEALRLFLENLKSLFAPKATVAYIESTDNEVIEGASTYLTTSDVVDTLTSTNSERPLSANQGKILNDKIEELKQNAISVAHDNNGNVSVVSNFNNKTVSHDGTGNVIIS